MATRLSLLDAFGSAPGDEPAPAPQWDPSQPDLSDRLMEYRQAQEESLAEHQNYAAGLQRAGQQVQERQQDLVIAERFSQLLSPDIPRPAKQYLFRETARVLGLDPRSAATKDLGSLLTQLDPDSAQALRGMLVAQSREAQPGQVREMARALLSGNVPMSDIMRQVSEFQRGQVADDQQRLGDVFGSGLVHRTSAPSTRVPVPPNTEQPATMSPVVPELLPLLGLPIDQQQRHIDLQERGLNIPSDAVGQRKLAETLRTEQAGISNLLSNIGRLQSLLDNPQSQIGAGGFVTRTLDELYSQYTSARRALGLEVDQSLNPNSGQGRFELERVVRNVMKTYNIDRTAENSAIIRSLVAQMGFDVASGLLGQQGRALSDADLAAAYRMLGESQSKEQFSAVLQSLSARAYDAYSTRVATQVGRPLDFNIRVLPDETLRAIGRSRATPAHIRQGIADEMERRDGIGAQPRAVDDQPPGQPRQPTDTPRAPADAQPAREPSQTQRETRRRPTVEEEQTALRAQAAEAQRLVREAQALTQALALRGDARAERNADLQQQSFDRAQTWRNEDKVERQQQRLQAIFERLGAVIARGGGGGGGGGRSGGGGGEQSPAAFQLPSRQQRRAPQVPQLPLRGFDGLKGK